MIYGAIVGFVFILSFAYIILTLANKESGNMKLAGQVLSGLIALIALIMLIFGSMGHKGMMGGCPMSGSMMGGDKEECEMMKDNPKMMDKMMKDKGTSKMSTKKMMNKTK
jgi:hypothetical protein